MKGSVHEVLYSEAQSGVLVTVQQNKALKFEQHCKTSDLPFNELGVTGGDRLIIDEYLDLTVSEMKTAYESAIPNAMENRVEV